MSKADGTVTFSAEFDNKELAAQVDEATKKVESIEGKIKSLEKDRASAVREAERAQKQLTKEQEAYNAAVEKSVSAGEQAADAKKALLDAQQKLKDLEQKKLNPDAVLSGQIESTPGQYILAKEKSEQLSADLKNQQAEVQKLTKDWQTAQSAVERYDAALADAQAKVDAAAEGVRNAQASVSGIDANLEAANAELASATARAGDLSAKFQQAERRATKLKNPIDMASASVDKLVKRIKRLAINAAIFSVVAKWFSAFKDRIKDAIATNEDAAQAMSRLKGAVLTVIQPIIDAAVPALTAMANALTHVITLTMSLFGKDFLANNKKAAKDLSEKADAIDGVADAAKNAKNSIAGFDELNVMNSNDVASSSKGGTTSPNFDFDMDASEMSAELNVILAAVTAIAVGLAAWKISSSFLSGVGETSIAIGLLLAGITAVVFALQDWITTGALTDEMCAVLVIGILAIGAAIALLTGSWIPLLIAAIVALVAVFFQMFGDTEQLMQGLKEIFSGFIDFFVGIFSGDMEKAIGGIGKIVSGLKTVFFVVLDAIKNAMTSALDWFDKITGGRFSRIIQVIKDFISDTAKNIKQVLDGIITFISGVFTGDWGKAWQGVKEVLKGVLNQCSNLVESIINFFISRFEMMLNWIIGGLNKISFDVPDLVPGLGGKQFGFNIKEVSFGRVSIPRLAQGAVLPANEPFMAVVGDQKHGTNVEAPLETIQEAVNAVMAERDERLITVLMQLVGVAERIEQKDTSVTIGDETIGRANDRYVQNRGVRVNSGAFSNAY